ncbi:NAD(P)/FAD-dependent oxidoreductase [Frigidibacter sp. MR17.24]|uniref:NAD(P)/FAD-dependent oxidoreductase n=1 Tax=Frigidibacter sp. MR17.24 TaxID=3127345 RepID=UPI003012FA3B
MADIVILGAGQAAVSAIETLRKAGSTAAITLIGDETALPYQRPPLSKAMLKGEVEAATLSLRPQAWYEGVTLRLGVRAERIDRAAACVQLSDGTAVRFDRLLLCTGSQARRLPSGIGGTLAGVLSLRGLGDAVALRGALAGARRLAVIGGGYVGLEVAAVARGLGLEVTLVEAGARILNRVACAETAALLRARHRAEGVRIIEGCGVSRILGETRAQGVELDDGTVVPADLVLVGIGAVAGDALAAAAGLATRNGILVDGFCATEDPRIFAAGDCATFPLGGVPGRLESVQNAIDQAACAAQNMLGASVAYAPVPWFWSDQYDLKLQIAGIGTGADRIVTCAGKRAGAVSHWYYAGDRLCAVDAVSDPAMHMLARRFLAAGSAPAPDAVAEGWQAVMAFSKAPA